MVCYKKRYSLLLLFVCSLLVRIIFFYLFLKDNPCQLMYDAAHYHEPAVSLALGKGFSVNDVPYFYRLPGYSLFLSTCYLLFGVNPTYALMMQILIASCIPLLVYVFVTLIFPHKRNVAYLAAWSATFHPGLVIYSGLVMTETLFLFFFTAFLSIFFLVYQHQQWHITLRCNYLFIAGVLLACTSLIRPIGHYILPIAILILCCQHNKLRQILFLLSGWISVVMPWVLRNFLLTGYLFFHTLPGPHCINHGAIRIAMIGKGLTWNHARDQVYNEVRARVTAYEHFHQKKILEIEESILKEEITREYMRAYPVAALRLMVMNCLKTFFSLYSSELLMIDSNGKLPSYDQSRSLWTLMSRYLVPDVYNRAIILVIYYEVLFFLMVVCGCIGFLFQWVKDPYRTTVILASIVLIALFIGLSALCGFARFRIPCEPFLIMFASCFWVSVRSSYFASQRSSGSSGSISSS